MHRSTKPLFASNDLMHPLVCFAHDLLTFLWACITKGKEMRKAKVLFRIVICLLMVGFLIDYITDLNLISINSKGVFSTIRFGKSPATPVSSNVCPELSLNRTSKWHAFKYSDCKPKIPSKDDCRSAHKRYGRRPRDYSCPKLSNKQFLYDICRFRESSVFSRTEWKLDCNIKICGRNIVRIGVLQQHFGLMIDSTMWYTARTNNEIQKIIRKILKETGDSRHDFCIITCANKRLYIKQALVFPPRLKTKKTVKLLKQDTKININLVVLDSISRQHFYRQLPYTVYTLNNISSATSVYDYEMFQSIAPRTFPNMRALFSGVIDPDSNDDAHEYGIASLFGKYNNIGYETVLQEDSCWYDPWGAIITENKHNLKPLLRPFDYQQRWRYLQEKLQHLPIGSYGMTHLSCEVFNDYGLTNQFNYPPKVCYNGYHFPEYFLNYTHNFLLTTENIPEAYPLFIYTHLNTGHETSGRRIANTDLILARFVKQTANLKNTLTILVSDHGPKTTKFAREYLAGRNEISHAVMFMIIPENVKKFLGENRLQALGINQHRLITHSDLFQAFMTLHTDVSGGLLQEITAKRNCVDIPMYSFMSCICEGWNENLPDFHREVHWLAEFAVGYLNNLITAALNHTNYGNCERLVGKRYDKIRRRRDMSGNVVYTFDLVVHKYRDEELFEVVVTLSSKTDRNAVMTRWRRISIYQHFSKCRDKDVDIELCICRKESHKEYNVARELARALAISSFEVKTLSTFIDSECLALLTRTLPEVFVSYEITNMCVDRQYNVTFQLTKPEKVTTVLPLTIYVRAWMIYYVTTVSLLDHPKAVKENITYTLVPVTEGRFYYNIV